MQPAQEFPHFRYIDFGDGLRHADPAAAAKSAFRPAVGNVLDAQAEDRNDARFTGLARLISSQRPTGRAAVDAGLFPRFHDGAFGQSLAGFERAFRKDPTPTTARGDEADAAGMNDQSGRLLHGRCRGVHRSIPRSIDASVILTMAIKPLQFKTSLANLPHIACTSSLRFAD